MTDYSELVERMRAYPANKLCIQIADALEAQAKEIAELKERAEKFEKANDWLIARNRTLEAENQKVLDDWPLASP
jgi:hypothetical protein